MSWYTTEHSCINQSGLESDGLKCTESLFLKQLCCGMMLAFDWLMGEAGRHG